MTISADSRSSLDAGSPWRTLVRDRIVRLAAGLFAVAFAIDRLASDDGRLFPWVLHRLVPLLFLGLVLVALRHGFESIQARGDRTFWNDLSFAFACWTTSALILLTVAPGTDPPLTVRFLADILYAIAFIGLLLAVELQPHRRHRWRPIRLERRLTWPTVVLGVCGFFFYFLVLPLAADRPAYDTAVPSSAFILTFDTYLAVRLLFLVRATRKRLWRSTYALLLATLILFFIEDALEGAGRFGGNLGGLSGLLAGSWWNLPWVTLILAIRLRRHPFPVEPPPTAEKIRLEENLPGPLGQTMVFLLLFPLVHFALYDFGILSEEIKPHREILLLVWLPLLGFYGVGQYRALVARLTRLRQERSRTERVLHQMEQDMRLQAQRQQTSAAVRASDERFTKAFRACPDVMAISRLEDGRLIEVNPSCRRMFGWAPREWIGRTTGELEIWAWPEERDQAVELIRSTGEVRDFESNYRTRDGRVRQSSFSASVLEIDGETLLFSVTHDITRSKEHEAELRQRLSWLERVRSAVIALDAAGHIVYWNVAAERLWGLSAGEVLGQPAADFAERGLLPPNLLDDAAPPFLWSGQIRDRTGREIAVDRCAVPIVTRASPDDEPEPGGVLVLARRREDEPPSPRGERGGKT